MMETTRKQKQSHCVHTTEDGTRCGKTIQYWTDKLCRRHFNIRNGVISRMPQSHNTHARNDAPTSDKGLLHHFLLLVAIPFISKKYNQLDVISISKKNVHKIFHSNIVFNRQYYHHTSGLNRQYCGSHGYNIVKKIIAIWYSTNIIVSIHQ